jgi:hypothetical protein
LVAILFLALTVVACGGGSEDQVTVSPSATATSVSALTDEVEGDDGIVRTAWNKTGDAGNWVWDRVSGAGSWIWGGVSGTGGWLWSRVSGLPGEVADIFARFWRWIKGSGLGESARQTVVTVQTVASAVSDFSVSGFLWRIVRYVLYAVLALIVLWLLFFRMVLPFVGGLPGRVVRTAGQSMQRGRQAEGQRRRIVTAERGKSPAGQDSPARTTGKSSVDGTAIADPQWSKSQIVELKRHATNPTIVALFDLARSSDGEPVNYGELMDVTGRTANQVRADFAAFSQACRTIHGDDVWPVRLVPSTDGSSRTAYLIDNHYLEWWFER